MTLPSSQPNRGPPQGWRRGRRVGPIASAASVERSRRARNAVPRLAEMPTIPTGAVTEDRSR